MANIQTINTDNNNIDKKNRENHTFFVYIKNDRAQKLPWTRCWVGMIHCRAR